MNDKRDNRINDKLDEMSEFFKHSDRKAQEKSNFLAEEARKNDILNELPPEIRFKALQNGMSFEQLRELYAEVKAEYNAKKADFQSSRVFANERRQDNVRERVLEQEKERQNEMSHSRSRRRQRQYVRV